MRTEIKKIIIGSTLFILGAIIVPMAIVLPLMLRESNNDQFRAPGTTQVNIDKPGRYYLWNDHITVFEGKSYNRSEHIPDNMEFVFQNKGTNEKLEFISDTSISSSSGSSSKNSIGYIEVQNPGDIDINISGDIKERVFSFSQSDILLMIGLIFGGCALSMILGFTGFGIAVWGVVQLIQSNKKPIQNKD
ncbi:hypothetical protein PQO03_02545 [Lentisphaera profundi]|uniref:Uncharacterized protein n=1 Tax=Lentisphaera profundi TaxID=1658616 RepID=A0ABY7VU51_9BACT|nr:hypothetical protein [Lentisphaera profundi]WDE96839.1 hypothetical protein PQO03_02545 [Lentisphaera profundi]